MTGFPRPGRSFYLDDMDVIPGDLVICKSALDDGFTPGRAYVVEEGRHLIDDNGERVIPSARFVHLPRALAA